MPRPRQGAQKYRVLNPRKIPQLTPVLNIADEDGSLVPYFEGDEFTRSDSFDHSILDWLLDGHFIERVD